MASRNETVSQLLPKASVPDGEMTGGASGAQRKPRLLIYSLALSTALLLSLVLLPRAPLEGIGSHLSVYTGIAVLILLVFYLFYRDVKRYRPALTIDRQKLILLASLLCITVIIARFSQTILLFIADDLSLNITTVNFALPVASGAMLVSLLLDFHLALAFAFVTSLLIGIMAPGDPLMPFYYFSTSVMAALHVLRCKKRSAVIRAGGMTALVAFVAIIGIDLHHGQLAGRGLFDLGAGFIGAVLTATIVSVSLPLFEGLFGIATDIKLLELLDPNRPLLKELVYRTPGTHHHSIVIGNLAEAAAEAINENPLLARVGSYYHDIGKVHRPEYFVENQRTDENKHDALDPAMSSRIIASHVSDGVIMAKEHKLPSSIVDIISQHHGNSLITYFYEKAKERQASGPVMEQDFRYPGPRPRTKVAAIVMLADAVEAASRTLSEPSSEQVQGLVNSVITRIFLDDQLSACDLTLRDLRVISRSFEMVLSGIFHHRIDYPGVVFAGARTGSEHLDTKHAEEARTTDSTHPV